ncbi:MAG: polyprenyl diphosphate synthase [Pseudomonadota bacterium]|nr:polyprenyl diphosphate synthase [Pseudomonadota bacterium]
MTNQQDIKCVGFIMDGNRRYAREQKAETFTGHLAGKDKLFEVIKWVAEKEIPHAVFYAFSTENWQRDKVEVEKLMQLFQATISELAERDNKDEVAVRIIGQRTDLSLGLQESIRELEAQNPQEPQLTIWIALSYGGRAEILAAVNQAVTLGKEVNLESFSSLFWSTGMPDPDLIIRTGGESRLSNFLPWQTVYSELFFSSTYWPAFTKDEFERIVSTYIKKDRRIGK